MIEIDFIRSDIFEEVLNYMYTAKIAVKKKDVNLMMSSGQILGIRFLDKLCSQVGALQMITPVMVNRKRYLKMRSCALRNETCHQRTKRSSPTTS